MFTKKKGFTLVELIVVIAIIAILIAVTIPSFTRYVDQSRFSNDTQSAASMTTVLQNHLIIEAIGDLDAHDVREIIKDYNGGDYEFTPQAKDTGFFYISSGSTIIAARFDQVEGIVETLSLIEKTTLLNDPISENENRLPEQLFHQKSHLLSFKGSAVAEVVHFVSTMANQGSAIGFAHGEVLSKVESLSGNLIVRLFGFGLNPNIKDYVQDMLEMFDPDETLFVNNVSWVTTATGTSSIKRIVFTPGISNIPSFGLSLTKVDDVDYITLSNLVIPRTVKTIESNAFPENSFDIANAIIKQGAAISLVIENNEGIKDIERSQVLDFSIDALIDYSYYVRKTDNGYDLSALKDLITEEITGYNIFTSGQYYEVLIYTANGLIGFARNIYTINYFYNYGDYGLYRTERSLEGIFSNPVIPIVRSGCTFDSWNSNPSGGESTKLHNEYQLKLDGHPHYVWNAYAIWTGTNCS